MPDVRELADLLGAGQSPETIAQQSTIEVLKVVFQVLAALAAFVFLVALVSGLLFRTVIGGIAVVCVAGGLAYLGIVAAVFAATNRQFVQIVPSYTLAVQALLIIGLFLAVAVSWRAADSGGLPRDADRPRGDWVDSDLDPLDSPADDQEATARESGPHSPRTRRRPRERLAPDAGHSTMPVCARARSGGRAPNRASNATVVVAAATTPRSSSTRRAISSRTASIGRPVELVGVVDEDDQLRVTAPGVDQTVEVFGTGSAEGEDRLVAPGVEAAADQRDGMPVRPERSGQRGQGSGPSAPRGPRTRIRRSPLVGAKPTGFRSPSRTPTTATSSPNGFLPPGFVQFRYLLGAAAVPRRPSRSRRTPARRRRTTASRAAAGRCSRRRAGTPRGRRRAASRTPPATGRCSR